MVKRTVVSQIEEHFMSEWVGPQTSFVIGFDMVWGEELVQDRSVINCIGPLPAHYVLSISSAELRMLRTLILSCVTGF